MSYATVIVFACLSVVGAAIPHTIRQTTLGGDPFPKARNCTANGEKCAGAPGFANVPFAACCNRPSFVCGYPKQLPQGLWGMFCMLPGEVNPNKDNQTIVTTVPPVTDKDGSTVTTEAVATDKDGSTITTTTDATTTEVATTATATTTKKNDDDGDSACFPGSATVELADGRIVQMSNLNVGDSVKVSRNEYSPVFMFTHRLYNTRHTFVQVMTSTGAKLTLSPGHYLHMDGRLAAASTLKIGSSVTLGDGVIDTVVSVNPVNARGLYNPQTLNGDIVVDGVLTSTYTTAVEPSIAHAALAPFRALHAAFGATTAALESGGGALADIAPRGAAEL